VHRSGKKNGSLNLSRRGFTLVEVAVVLAVAGFVLAMIWWAAGKAGESQKENDALSELQTVVQNIDTMMTGQSFPAAPAFPYNDTKNMITAQAIPGSYIQNAAAANNPWSLGNFYVWAVAANQFRVSFYKVNSQGGCMALLLKGTSCQAGQSGCPTQVGTGSIVAAPAGPAAANSCKPNQTCPGALAAPGLGWQVMSVTAASALCAVNSYVGGANNSVEFFYSP
jgi:prepilin-type N-terminal cleavage/methylation domain-containing protein